MRAPSQMVKTVELSDGRTLSICLHELLYRIQDQWQNWTALGVACIHRTGQCGLRMLAGMQRLALRYYQSLSNIIIVALTAFALSYPNVRNFMRYIFTVNFSITQCGTCTVRYRILMFKLLKCTTGTCTLTYCIVWNVVQVLARLTQTAASSDGTTSQWISQSFLEHLQNARGDYADTSCGRAKRHKVSVAPGKSMIADDVLQLTCQTFATSKKPCNRSIRIAGRYFCPLL
jgi:hypothetical protein